MVDPARETSSLPQPSDEGFALGQLRQAHVLVGLVGLTDGTRAADDGGNACALEQARLGAESHQCGLLLAGQALRQGTAGSPGGARKAGMVAKDSKLKPADGSTAFIAGSN